MTPPTDGLDPDGRRTRLARTAAALLAVNVAWRLLVALRFPLYYDEAYLWELSRFPSAGYLDHPPLTAWIIAALTALGGDHSLLAIRGGALLLWTGSLLLVHRLARRLFDDPGVASRALLLALGLPLPNALGTVMTPEAPMVFFDLLALDLFVTGLRTGRWPAWALAGVAAGLGLLAGLAVGTSILALGAFLLLRPARRAWLARPQPWIALALALLTLAPLLCWNATHDWAGLRLQLWLRPLQSLGLGPRKLPEVLFEQLASTSIFLALPLLGALGARTAGLPPAWREGFALLRAQALGTLLFFALVGAVSQTHPHWTILAYPPAAITLAALWTGGQPRLLTRGLGWAVGLSQATLVIAAGGLLLGLALLPRVEAVGLGGPLGRGLAAAPARLLGWPDLARQAETLLDPAAGPGQATLFGHGHQRASLLWFHRERPEPVINLQAYLRRGQRVGDAQWYTIPLEGLDGASGVLVTADPRLTAGELGGIFERVEELDALEQRFGDRVLDRYRAFRVTRLRAPVLAPPR